MGCSEAQCVMLPLEVVWNVIGDPVFTEYN